MIGWLWDAIGQRSKILSSGYLVQPVSISLLKNIVVRDLKSLSSKASFEAVKFV